MRERERMKDREQSKTNKIMYFFHMPNFFSSECCDWLLPAKTGLGQLQGSMERKCSFCPQAEGSVGMAAPHVDIIMSL